jgi:hypothetical protein
MDRMLVVNNELKAYEGKQALLQGLTATAGEME